MILHLPNYVVTRAKPTTTYFSNKQGKDLLIVATPFGCIPVITPKIDYRIIRKDTLPYEDECTCVCHDDPHVIHFQACCRPRSK